MKFAMEGREKLNDNLGVLRRRTGGERAVDQVYAIRIQPTQFGDSNGTADIAKARCWGRFGGGP